ncbi:MAG TPA: immune inhibitor A domain-containing protein, partial [Ramlibacter sp.]|nr:immune inhibitor A domain-containing protein [Ramlibacter sp.]
MKLLPRAAAAALVVLCVRSAPLAAQQRPVERRYAAGGIRLEFPANAVWRAKARQVARTRALLRAQGRMGELNAAVLSGAPQPAATAVAGTLRYPTILIGFADTDTSSLPKAAQYDSVIYTAQPLTAPPNETGPRPYTVRTFYEEMSHGLFSVQGDVYGWILADSSQAYYLDACGAAPNNMLDCATGLNRMRQLYAYALHRLDSLGVDFKQYDANGDGQVDLVQFLQPVVGAECYNATTSPWVHGIWAHHFTLAGLPGGAYTFTNSNSNGVTVGAYQQIS